MQLNALPTEFFSLTGDEGSYRPHWKLDYLCSKNKAFKLKNGRVSTSFRAGPILSLPLLLLTISRLYPNALYPRRPKKNPS